MHRMFAVLQAPKRQQHRQERGLAVVEPLVGPDGHGHVLVEIDRISVGRLPIAVGQVLQLPWPGWEEILAPKRGEGVLYARVIDTGSVRDLPRVDATYDAEFVGGGHVCVLWRLRRRSSRAVAQPVQVAQSAIPICQNLSVLQAPIQPFKISVPRY